MVARGASDDDDAEVTAGDEDQERGQEQDGESVESRVTSALEEFAEAGYPSEEGDVKDPVSRTKALNGAVDDINSLMDSEMEVLGQAFDLLEKLGVKGLERPPPAAKTAAEDDADTTTNAEEADEEEKEKEKEDK